MRPGDLFARFEQAMVALGPLATPPHLAVAVSGGADSMALALLCRRWAAARGGRVSGLTVDHALRPESAEEAVTVGRWLAGQGIAHAVLTRHGPPFRSNLQAQARAARYALLAEWCRDHGGPPLLLAHQAEDQAETVLLRLARGSGVNGLSAMVPRTALGDCIVLRPLLDISGERLRAFLREVGQPWIEDPSNGNPAFARVRWRALRATLAAEGLTTARLCATAARMARARAALDDAAERLLAQAARFHPWGWAEIQAAPLRAAPPEIGLRALAALVMRLGGLAHTPRLDRLERALARLGQAQTLGGVRFGQGLGQGETLLAAREGRGLPVLPFPAGGGWVEWDGRFLVRATPQDGLSLGPLRAADWAVARSGCRDAVPPAARGSLPAVHLNGEFICVALPGWDHRGLDGLECRPLPRHGLASGSAWQLSDR